MDNTTLGSPADGPRWTVVGVYEDADPLQLPVFHVHAASLPAVLEAVTASQARYGEALEQDRYGEHAEIPSNLVDPVVFAGAQTALN